MCVSVCACLFVGLFFQRGVYATAASGGYEHRQPRRGRDGCQARGHRWVFHSIRDLQRSSDDPEVRLGVPPTTHTYIHPSVISKLELYEVQQYRNSSFRYCVTTLEVLADADWGFVFS